MIATILVLSLVGTASATNWSVDGSGGADFIKIQDAINDASDGDTIIVHSGVYSEKVVVNKSITLKGKGHPVVDAGGKGDAIIISAILSADGVTLEGFTVTNSESFGCCEGIMVRSSNNTITGNNISSTSYGIILSFSSNNNTITGNKVHNTNGGIYLSRSSNNSITGNNVCNNNWGGIYLFKSGKNTISGNTFVNDGFRVDDSYQNTVEDNTVNGKPLVYLEDAANYRVTDAGQVILVNCTNLSVENLDLSNTSVGIKLWKTTNSRISNNNLSNNNDGIRLDYSSNNTISGNNACNNNWHCISLHESSNNCITGNDVCNNKGSCIRLSRSSSNSITGNNLGNNNGYGIDLIHYSRNNIISGNTVNNHWIGISLSDSRNNCITSNNIGNNDDGINFDHSSNNSITGNTFVNDDLFVDDYSYQNTVENNTVNGKPLVYLEAASDYTVEAAGQVILVNCTNITVENLVLPNTRVGIKLQKTTNSRISNNNIRNNNDAIYLYGSSNNAISGNNAGSNRYGIRLRESNNNDDGIYLKDSCNNNTITGNNVSNNGEGIYLQFSSNNHITGNNASNNRYGIHLSRSSNNNSITGNTFVNDGLSVDDYSCHNTVGDNNVNGKPLVYLEDVSNYKVEEAGQVILVNCTNITVENLDISNTSVGILLGKTGNSMISNNNLCNNGDGICLRHSRNNAITGNKASNNNKDGILLEGSHNNIINGNTFANDGLSVDDYSWQNTVEDNKVNDKPLVYLEDASDYKVTDAGQVILVNCTNISVEDLDLSNTSVGIELWKTESSRIRNNKVSNNNRYGIYLKDYSNNNIITGNKACRNSDGICISYSGNNIISGNNVCNNSGGGISLPFYNSNNKIYLNNFINNTDNVNSINVDSVASTNIWNLPSGITYTYNGTTYESYLGNYWDDYEGTDADGDGIGNTPYSIDSKEDESDDYPLMMPFENYLT